ncbi:hypothetical protein [Kitasatospora sp. NPDC097643]
MGETDAGPPCGLMAMLGAVPFALVGFLVLLFVVGWSRFRRWRSGG